MSYADRCSPPEREVILESADGVRYEVQAELLASKSEFFFNLLQLPTPSITNTPIIPMMNTGSQALLVLVQWVKDHDLSLPTPISEPFFNDILQLADAYDVLNLPRQVLLSCDKCTMSPPMSFLLAVYSGCSNLNTYTLDILPFVRDFANDATWAIVLFQVDHKVYTDLKRLLQVWGRAASTFTSLHYSQSKNFSSQCRTGRGRRKPRCPVALEFHGDFEAFRRKADPSLANLLKLREAVVHFKAWPYFNSSVLLKALGIRELDCPICCSRLLADLQKAVRVEGEALEADANPLFPVELGDVDAYRERQSSQPWNKKLCFYPWECASLRIYLTEEEAEVKFEYE